MTKTYTAAVLAAMLVLRWLAVSHVTIVAFGLTATVPVLAVAAAMVAALAVAVAALLVWRDRAERAMSAQRAMHTAWQASKAGAR